MSRNPRTSHGGSVCWEKQRAFDLGDFPASHVSLPEGASNLVRGFSRNGHVFGHRRVCIGTFTGHHGFYRQLWGGSCNDLVGGIAANN